MVRPHAGLLSAQALLDNGYTRFHDPFSAAVLRAAYLGSYQLRFADSVGTRYVIAVHHGIGAEEEDGARAEFFSPEAQLTLAGLRFNVELLPRGQSVGEVERFFARLWQSMALDYCEGPDGQPCYPQKAAR